MSDIVLRLPLQDGVEARLFGDFLARFMAALSDRVDAFPDDAPSVMVRSEPLPDMDVKVLIFQERATARAFSAGWAKVRRGDPDAA